MSNETVTTPPGPARALAEEMADRYHTWIAIAEDGNGHRFAVSPFVGRNDKFPLPSYLHIIDTVYPMNKDGKREPPPPPREWRGWTWESVQQVLRGERDAPIENPER